MRDAIAFTVLVAAAVCACSSKTNDPNFVVVGGQGGVPVSTPPKDPFDSPDGGPSCFADPGRALAAVEQSLGDETTIAPKDALRALAKTRINTRCTRRSYTIGGDHFDTCYDEPAFKTKTPAVDLNTCVRE